MPPAGGGPPPFFQAGAAPSVPLHAVISVASRSVTSQPASSFPATASHPNPAGLAQISDQTCPRAAARTRALLSAVRGPAGSSARRTVVSDAGAPKTGS